MNHLEWIVPLIAMLAAGLGAGFAAGLFGIGGGFVVVPALFVVLPLMGVSRGELAHVAIGTSLATIVVTSLRSLQAHARRGAVEFEVLRTWAPWIVVGVGFGVLLASHFSGGVLATVFGVGVMLMALNFLLPLVAGRQFSQTMPTGATLVGIAGSLGAFSALLGIGGGTIAIIVMTLCGRPIHRAIATAAGVGVIIALPGMIGFAVIGWHKAGLPFGSLGYVCVPAALIVTSTSILSAPWGVAAAHALSPALLRKTFGIYLLVIGAIMIRNGLAH